MNAHALLTSQGWRGSGHSLHPTSDQTGLSRPLLVSRKQNNLGVGKKQHKTSDMWWMNAFDKSLKGLDTSTEGKVIQTVTNSGLDMVAKGGSKFVGSEGLYACFVKGESLTGTITPEDQESRITAMIQQRSDEMKEERRARKAARRAARTANASLHTEPEEVAPEGKGSDDAPEAAETKEQRRERRRQKKLLHQKEKEELTTATVTEATYRKKRRKD
jgi:nucleolar protein TMA23